MIPTQSLPLAAAALLLTACIQLPDVAPPQAEVQIVTPAETVYTNGTLELQVEVTGTPPDKVELLLGDAVLTTLEPPYTFQWDTTSTPEGRYQVTGRVHVAGELFTSTPREIVIDRTPPSVLALLPENQDWSVWVRQPIQATFSEQVKASTITSDSVTMSANSAYTALTLSLSNQDNVLTITPAALPPPPIKFQIELKQSVTDLAGNALIPITHWNFDMPDWLDLGNLQAEETLAAQVHPPDLQLDPQGQPVVLWREGAGPDKSTSLYVRRYVNGKGWEALGGAVNSTPIPAAYNSRPLFHTLQLDSSGTPLVAWIQPDGSTPGVIVKSWQNNEWVTLGGPLNVTYPDAPITPPQSLSFKLDSAGTPHLAWLNSDALRSRSYIHVAFWAANHSTWIYSQLNPDISINYSTEPLPISMDFQRTPSDQLMITWESADGVSIAYKNSDWRYLPTTQAHPEASTPTSSPSILYAPGFGFAVAAFIEFDGNTQNIHVQQWTGSIWQPIGEPLSAFPGTTPALNLRLVKDKSGSLYVMWEEAETEGGTVSHHIRRRLRDGSSWEVISGLSNYPSPAAPAFAVDASGTLFAAWAESSSTGIRVRRLNQ